MNKKLLFGLVFLLLVSFASVFGALDDAEIYYSFDDSNLSGVNPLDLSGNGNDGTNSPSMTTGVTGVINEAFSSTTNTQVGTGLTDDTGAFSFKIQHKIDDFSTYGAILGKFDSTAGSRWVLDKGTSSGNVRFYLRNNAGTDNIITATGLTTGTFYQFIGTFDGTTMKLYVDGDLIGSTTTGAYSTGSQQLVIGRYSAGTSPAYGDYDEFGFWTGRALTDGGCSVGATCGGEIAELYNSGAGLNPYAPTPTSTNFTITGKDADDNSNLQDLNITLDFANGTQINYTKSTGNIINTQIANNDTILVNVTGYSTNYTSETVLNWNLTSDLTINLTGLPLEDFELLTPNQTITTNDTFNITWTEAVSPTDKVVTYNGTIAYETNATVVDTFSTTNLYYLLNVTDYASQNYSVTILASEQSTGDNFSHTNYLAVDRPNYLYFYDEESGNPIENASITITLPNYNTDLSLTTDSNGSVTFDSYYNNTLQTGNYSITFEDFIGFVTPVTFTETYNNLPINESFNISVVNIEVFLFYRSNFTTFDKNSTVVIEGIDNFTTSNGTILLKNASIINGDYRITVFSEGFFNEEKVFIYTGQTDIDVNVYLLEINQSNSGTVTIRTVDEFSRLLGDTRVNLLEYDTSTLSYGEVSQCNTDSNGECKFLIETNTKSYKFTASKEVNGNTVTASTEPQIFEDSISGGEVVLFSEETITLTLSSLERFELNPIQNIIYNSTESFNNVTNQSNIDVSFRSIDGTNLEVCVEYFTIAGGVETSLTGDTFCVTASSGEVTENAFFTLNRSKEYVAKVYIKSGSAEILLEQYKYQSFDSFAERLKNNATLPFVFLFIWIFLIASGLALKNVPLVGVAIIVGTWTIWFFFPSITIVSASVLQTLIGISLIYVGRKKEDFN